MHNYKYTCVFIFFFFQAVQKVVTNLLISHIELRSEESLDIQKYLHERKVEKIVVPLDGEVSEVKNTFKKVRTVCISSGGTNPEPH